MSSSAKASQEAGLCVLTIQAFLCAEVAAFFCRFCFAKLWFFPWVLPCICRTGSVYESFIINFLLGFHIFGELFRLQAEKLIF